MHCSVRGLLGARAVKVPNVETASTQPSDPGTILESLGDVSALHVASSVVGNGTFPSLEPVSLLERLL